MFEPLPGEGRWGTVLLLDGNVGIGGDPVALLERAAPPGPARRPGRGRGRGARHADPAVTVRLESAAGRWPVVPVGAVGADGLDDVAGGRRPAGHGLDVGRGPVVRPGGAAVIAIRHG